MQAYYQRIATAYNDILKSRLTKGYSSLKPSTSKSLLHHNYMIDIYDVSKPMKEIAMGSWKIKELPGRSPLTQWPESLDDLNNRLLGLEPMAAWHEPIPDVSCTHSLYLKIGSDHRKK